MVLGRLLVGPFSFLSFWGLRVVAQAPFLCEGFVMRIVLVVVVTL